MKNKFLIELTPRNKSFPTHIWKEGGEFFTKKAAEFQAKQIRKMRYYANVKVIKSNDKNK